MTRSRSWDIFNLRFIIFPCPTHYRASSVKCDCAQVCRNGRLYRLERCTGERSYDARTQLCCQGVVHQKLAGHKCCQPGTSTYNPQSQTCCNGQVFDDKPHTSFRWRLHAVSDDAKDFVLCFYVLLFGLECFSVAKADIRSLDFAVTRFSVKLFKLINSDIINYYYAAFNAPCAGHRDDE